MVPDKLNCGDETPSAISLAVGIVIGIVATVAAVVVIRFCKNRSKLQRLPEDNPKNKDSGELPENLGELPNDFSELPDEQI